MRTLTSLALVAASIIAFPVATPTLAVDTSISAKCGPDGPESYKRPGGYCDQIGANHSLGGGSDGGCNNIIIIPTPVDLSALPEAVFLPQERILVAENCIVLNSTAVE